MNEIITGSASQFKLNLKTTFGYCALFFYCLITALSAITIHQEVKQHANPYLCALYTFLLSCVFFNIVNHKRFKETFYAMGKDKKNVFLINLTTALTWLPIFVGLKLIGPTAYLAIYLGSLPIMAVIFQAYATGRVDHLQLILAVLIAAVIFLVAINNTFDQHPMETITGYLLAIISGVSFSFYAIFSKKLETTLGYNPIQILATRFFLIVTFCLILCLTSTHLSIFEQDVNLHQFILISLLSTILPLYFLQSAIHCLGPNKTMTMLQSTLILIYLLELMNGVAFNLLLFCLVVLLSALLWGIAILQLK